MQKLIKLWKSNPESKKIGLLCVLVAVGILAGYFLVLQPMRFARMTVIQETKMLSQQVDGLRIYDLSEAEFEIKINQLTNRREQALQILPADMDSFVTVATITDIAKNNNLAMRSFRVGDNSIKNGYKIQRFDCVVTGGYFELIAFLEAIQKRRPLTSVQVTSINTETDSKLAATMQIYTYALE